MLRLKEFYPDEAVKYLLDATGENRDMYTKGSAREVAKELGYLPLALAQAASYIKGKSRIDFREYLKDFKNQQKRWRLLGYKLPGDNYKEVVLTT